MVKNLNGAKSDVREKANGPLHMIHPPNVTTFASNVDIVKMESIAPTFSTMAPRIIIIIIICRIPFQILPIMLAFPICRWMVMDNTKPLQCSVIFN